MRIWYLHHYATPPSYGLPGRPHALAVNMEELGHKVMVVCAQHHHLRANPAPDAEVYAIRKYEGVDYYHVPARPYQGNGIGRLLNMMDYARAVKSLSRRIDRGELAPPDILIPSCAHPLSFTAADALKKKCRAKLIYEVRDIWPLSIVELLGVPSVHPLVLWFQYIEKRAYRRADAVVSLLPKAYEHMVPLGLDRRRFYYIPNGIDVQEWESPQARLPGEHENVFKQLRAEGKLIVIYAGAHGPPNALDQILNLAALHRDTPKPYHFVLIGEGVEKETLMKRAQDEGVSFVTFLPKISKQQVISAILLADVCFIASHKNRIYRFGTSPNKLGDYFMGAKPVLSALDTSGNDAVRESQAGISVEPYNVGELEDALRRFCSMTVEERSRIGLNGRNYALKNLDWKMLGRRYIDICTSLVE